MVKILKYITAVLFSLLCISVLSQTISINSDAFDLIAIFLSITTGFTITALSIIATSPFSKNLYLIESPKDNSKTLLHELVDRFKNSMILFILTISQIIFFNLLPNNHIDIKIEVLCTINIIDFLKSSIFYFSILSLISFILLFFTFSRFVIKSATLIK